MFTCEVYAFPAASVTWTYRLEGEDDENIPISADSRIAAETSVDGYVTSSILTFADITRVGDARQFYCTAENVHNVATATARLTVYGRRTAPTIIYMVIA